MARTPPEREPTPVKLPCSDQFSHHCYINRVNTCDTDGICDHRYYSNTDKHVPRDSGCYGYTTKDQLYSCPGHRTTGHNSDIDKDVPEPSSGSVIYPNYLNWLCQILNEEITARRKHKMYSQFRTNSTMVQQEDVISANQPNYIENTSNPSLSNTIDALRAKIANYEDYNNANTIQRIYNNITPSDIVKHTQLTSMYEEINNKWKDCICHSDCTSFGATTQLFCECNTNCGCDYG